MENFPACDGFLTFKIVCAEVTHLLTKWGAEDDVLLRQGPRSNRGLPQVNVNASAPPRPGSSVRLEGFGWEWRVWKEGPLVTPQVELLPQLQERPQLLQGRALQCATSYSNKKLMHAPSQRF